MIRSDPTAFLNREVYVRPSLRPTFLALVPVLTACAASAPTPQGGPEPAAVSAPASLPAAIPAPAPLPSGVAPSGEDPRIREIVAAVSPARLERDDRTLVGFQTRHTLSDTVSATRGIGASRRWLFAEFQRISQACGGCLEVMYVSDVVKGGSSPRIDHDVNIVDVVAVQRGRTDPDRYALMTAHYDSRVGDVMDSTSFAPGANDDGSGTVALLEAARALSRYQFDGTVVYAALAGEEQGLLGGEVLSRYVKQHGWRIEGVLNNDIIGNTSGVNGVTENSTARVFGPGIPVNAPEAELRRYLYSGGELDTPSRELMRYVDRVADSYVLNLDVRMIYRLDRFGRGGDHTPFFQQGFPAVRVTETNEEYTRQHQEVRTQNGIRYGDLPEGVDFPYLAKMTALNAATLASLAWAPASPDSVTITGALQPSATLRWRPVSAPDLAGYRVYWRDPESATWDHSRWVGNVTQATIDQVTIDNYFFGVAAVDREGHESRIVFPAPGRER
ncbi:MAG: M20/M25/M40 family metallo-hydrolase [Gemmatimonadetes bacterium]|nr:M20/M25/M40 family metallo-hydrolase [Gemmatimonadota bacterium]